MNSKILTLIIPNYKTELLTKLCLRLVRKFVDFNQVEVIVVDNASNDKSVEYLRSLPYIKLIERDVAPNETGPQMHALALDLAMKEVKSEFVLVMHTDTLLLRADALDFLLSKIRQSPDIAGVGSWKLEIMSQWKRFCKRIEAFIQRDILHHEHKEERYLRSHCALYRTDLVRQHTRGFYDGSTAGLSLHKSLVERGFKMLFLPSEELGKYVCHLNHATGILNPVAASRRAKTPRMKRHLQARLDEEFFQQILEDSTLDK